MISVSGVIISHYRVFSVHIELIGTFKIRLGKLIDINDKWVEIVFFIQEVTRKGMMDCCSFSFLCVCVSERHR